MLNTKLFYNTRVCNGICGIFIVVTGSTMLFLHDASDSLTYSSTIKSDDREHPTATVNTRGLITSYR